MKLPLKAYSAFALVTAMLLSLSASGAKNSPKPPAELKSRTFEFSYKAMINDVPAGSKRLNVWLPYPTTDANQEVYDIQVSSPRKATVYTEPRYGNSILFVSID